MSPAHSDPSNSSPPPDAASSSPPESPLVLVVEDEPKIASLLAEYLKASHYRVHVLGEGGPAPTWVREHRPSVVLLDLMLPGKDGLEVTRDIRAFSQVPIIMITARVEEIDRLLGLELGADDYICKPFSPREVIARVKAVLRRVSAASTTGGHASDDQEDGSGSPHRPHSKPLLRVDEHGFQAWFRDTRLDLTPAEFRLLHFLSKSQGRAFSREHLLNALYGDDRIVTDRTVDTHIKNLRRKLEQAGAPEGSIASVYGVGYRFEGVEV